MEIIVITDNEKYNQLIPDAKILNSSSADIINIIETQVFLNQHHQISLHLIRDNLPYQFQLPLKIAKQLLDRNQGSSIQLIVNDKDTIYLSSETDLVEIFSKIQLTFQQNAQKRKIIDKYYQKAKNLIKYSFKYWEIIINLIIIDAHANEVKFDDMYLQIKDRIENPFKNKQPMSDYQSLINKLIVYINQENHQQFINWGGGGGTDAFQNTQLSNQYLTLKQEIDNEKNSFRKKIKMVEAELGQKINVEKLLCEDDGKDENMQFKKLKETFQTIKNIDNVLMQQEEKIKNKKEILKQKKREKQKKHYGFAKQMSYLKKQLFEMNKDIECLKQKIMYTRSQKDQYALKRNFDPTKQIKQILSNQMKEMKKIFKSKKQKNHIWQKNRIPYGLLTNSSTDIKNFREVFTPTIDEIDKGQLMRKQKASNSIQHSTQYFCNKNKEQYQGRLRNKVLCKNQSKSMYGSENKQVRNNNWSIKGQQLLAQIYQYFLHVNEITLLIDQRLNKKKSITSQINQKSQICKKQIFDWKQFPILSELNKQKSGVYESGIQSAYVAYHTLKNKFVSQNIHPFKQTNIFKQDLKNSVSKPDCSSELMVHWDRQKNKKPKLKKPSILEM